MGNLIRVLHLEDDPRDAELVRETLKAKSISAEVKLVQTEAEFVAAIEEGELNLILADYVLPSFDGLSALRLAQARCPEIPFLFVSGVMGEDLAVEAMKAGAHDYVMKSNLKRLVPAIERELCEAEVRWQRRQVEAALRESEERFRQLAEHIDAVFWMSNADLTQIVYVSPAYERVWGRSRASLYAQPRSFLDAAHPDDCQQAVATLQAEQIGKGEPFVSEYRMVKPDRAVRWIRNRGFPVRNEAGQLLRMVGIAEDITERRRAEGALRENEQRYRALVETTGTGYVILDAQGKVLDANPEYIRLSGHRHLDEIRGRSVVEWTADYERVENAKAVAQCVKEGYIRNLEIDYVDAHGKVTPIEINATLVEEDGRARILTLCRDISERKQAEAERERLISAIEQAAEIIVITDAEGTIQYVNPAFVAVTGYAREEAVGRNPRILKSGVQDEAFYLNLWKTLTGGATWEGHFVNKKKDGTHYTEEATISPVRNAAGAVISYVAVKRDITEDLRMQKEREKLQAQFLQAQKMESIGRLAGGIAHDFNNILTGIGGYTELVLDQLDAASPLREDLAEVQRLTKRAADLTRQLLAFSRRQPLDPQILNLNHMLEDAGKMLKRVMGEDIDLHFAPAPDLGNVRADPGQIEQILMNLVVNSRDAMPAGGKLTIETANVELGAEYAGRHVAVTPGPFVMLAVSDTGCGMDAATKERIFEPFFTTKGKGRGTGLGLATVYGIVRQHGGNIWVYSEPGQGATFKIYLPTVAEAVSDVKPAVKTEIARGEETVLIVEDEAVVRAFTERCLKTHGYAVFTASNAEEAQQVFLKQPKQIALLLTDVVLPGMNGRKLYDLLKGKDPNLKVLYMSGYTDNAIVHQGMLDPGITFMQKPFTTHTLVRKVRQVLDS